MKKVKFYNLFLVIRLVGLSVCLGFLCVSLFSARVFAQGTPSTTDKLDSPPSAASTDAKTKAPQKTKKTTIDFEDQLIEGSRQKPELFYLLQNKDFNYKRLIRLREDFLPELRKSGEDIQGRSGGGQ